MRSKLSVAFIILIILGGTSTILAARNTAPGAGNDVSRTGYEVSEGEHR
jgi:predicted small secreted protein